MSIRIAVIGTGVMGADHARIVASDLPGAVLQVVCDVDEAKARQVADACGAVDIDRDPDATVMRGDVDAVILASPDPTHAPLSRLCIEARKPVLCEKPLSQSSEVCLTVLKAEQVAGRKFVQVGYMRRFDPPYVEMTRAVAEGRLGRVLMMHNFHRNVETPATGFTGAMAITNSAPHEFDAVRHVLGSEFTAISASQPRRSDSVVAPVVMVLETADGQLAVIEVNNNAAYGYDVRAELVGEAGSMSLNTAACVRIDVNLECRASYDPDWRGRFAEAYRQQNRSFVEFAASGRFSETAADCWDGYCAAVVGEAGVAALESGDKVKVDMIDKPDFYA